MEKNFATIIKQARKSRKLSQIELGKLCHTNGAEISRIETGITKKPARKLVVELCINLNLNQKEILDLLGYENVVLLEKEQEHLIAQLGNFSEEIFPKIYCFLDLISKAKVEDLEIIEEFLQNFFELSEKDKSLIRIILSEK